jgi:predicted ester cyclase
MSIEENRLLARRCFDELNRQFEHPGVEAADLDEVLSPTWAAEFRSWLPSLNRLWPGHHIEVADMVAEGNMVWCRLVTSGTDRGVWEGIPANGWRWISGGVWYLTIVDRKIVDIEWTCDELSLVRKGG